MNAPTTAHVPAPVLDLADDTPVSSAFGDVYFSRGGGVAETAYVFLKGNGLPERWAGVSRFTIAELGFGTGLNFLVTLKRFRESARAGAVLHYIAIEKYPFTPETLRAVLALQPELAVEAAELLAGYPLRLPGVHRIHLNGCVLTLCFGEVTEMLEELRIEGGIDAWYLDGFSPAKNPEMWSADILARVGALSGEGTTFATFTSAGEVRRGLQSAGFEVRKVAGFGHKREMSVGRIPRLEMAVRSADGPREPEAEGRTRGGGSGDGTPTARQRHIILIGAGIAGATLARAMAERGYQVTVLERGAVASGASGNAAGVLFPQLTKQWNMSTAWYFTAYGFALRQLARWQAEGLPFDAAQIGMLRLPRTVEEEAQLRTLNETLGLDASIVRWVEREEASAQAGVALQTGAAYFPQGSWVSPPSLCHALLQHNNILLREGCTVAGLAREDDGWAVTLENGEVIHAPQVCVASAHESAALLKDYGLRLNHVGGQVSECAAADAAPMLCSILCHKGYVIPLEKHPCEGFHPEPLAAGVSDSEGGKEPPSINSYLVGATYHREDMLAVTDARHAENMEQLQQILPDWPHGEVVRGRSSIRATTPDRMPYVGAVDAGLYVSTGHGSRGLLSAPLAAEMIASSMAGEMSPVTQALAKAVNPQRFKKA